MYIEPSRYYSMFKIANVLYLEDTINNRDSSEHQKNEFSSNEKFPQSILFCLKTMSNKCTEWIRYNFVTK